MIVHNVLPQLVAALRKWKTRPAEKEFAAYLKPLESLLRPMLDDFGSRTHTGLYQVIEGLSWESYREEALALDPEREERRVRKIIDEVERCLGLKLAGEVVLFGAFTAMDGYARFDQGRHRVYLGVDESHGRGAYLDVLVAHELAHVAREALPEVWAGFGLSSSMTHDEFVEHLPVIEHLMSEGFSCVISELLYPREPECHYIYQSEDGLRRILAHGPAVDRVVHAHLRQKGAHYSTLYDPSCYVPELPRYAHYVWAWLWVSHLLKDRASDNPRALLRMSAHDLLDDALSFHLPRSL